MALSIAFTVFQRFVQNTEYCCHGNFYTRAGGLFYVFPYNDQLYVLDDSKESNVENIFEMTYEKFLNMDPVYVELVYENDVPACQFFNMANRVIEIWGNTDDIPAIDSMYGEGEEYAR